VISSKWPIESSSGYFSNLSDLLQVFQVTFFIQRFNLNGILHDPFAVA